MQDKLDAIKARFDDLGIALTNPEIIADNKKFGQLSKEYRSLEKIVVAYNDYKKVMDDIEFYKEALNGMTKSCVTWPNWNYQRSRKTKQNGSIHSTDADS
jgi:protein subunit release factor A